MSATLERPAPNTIALFEAAGERLASFEERIWVAERNQMPPLVLKAGAGDAGAAAELKALRAQVAEWQQEVSDATMVLAHLEDAVVREREALRAKERQADFDRVRKLAEQQRVVAKQLSDAVEALPGLMRQYDRLQQQQYALAFPHMQESVIHAMPRRDSTDLLAARVGHLHLCGANDSPRHRADERPIAELADIHIRDWLRRLT